MPTITQLEYIIAVDRLQHFGEAARACHISQPTLSMQIQKAEEELGVVIFDREKKPVEATDKGRRLIEQAKVVVFEHEKFMQLSREKAGEVSGDFRLGVIPTLAPYIVPAFIKPFSGKYPKVNLTIDEIKTEDIIASIRSRDIDAGLLATPLQERGMRERVLLYEPFFLYVSAEHKLAQRKVIKADDLNADEVWLLQDGHCFRNQVINFCASKKSSAASANTVRFESGNFETLRNLVKAGDGYTLLPYLFVSTLSKAERQAHVRLFASPVPTREVSLIHDRNHLKLDVVGAIEEILKASAPKELLNMKKEHIEVLDI